LGGSSKFGGNPILADIPLKKHSFRGSITIERNDIVEILVSGKYLFRGNIVSRKRLN